MNTPQSSGYTGIPTYVVGPLPINGKYARGDFEIPIATCEKPLTLGLARGCNVARECGGVEAIVLKDEMTRAPVFTFTGLKSTVGMCDYAAKVCDYIEEDFEGLASIVESTTRYGKLTSLHPEIIGDNLYLRIGMFCGDAAGHNMTSKAALALSRALEEEFSGLRLVSLSGNYCTDKKVSAVNSLMGRGKKVLAQLSLPEEVCRSVLKTGIEEIYEIHVRKNLIGSIAAGSLCSANVHYANMLAALYLVTGQDVANVVEGSQGITTASLEKDRLLFSVTLPSLVVGTVGGGTSLPDQARALEKLGCKGSGNPVGSHAKKLAEIIGATVLVGELNALAALARPDRYIRAHELLERGQ